MTKFQRFSLLMLIVCVASMGDISTLLAQDSDMDMFVVGQVEGRPNDVSWSADSQYFAVGTSEGLTIFNVDTPSGLQIVADIYIYSVKWHPAIHRFIVTTANAAEIWDWDTNTETATLAYSLPITEMPLFAAWNCNGTRIALMSLTNRSPYQTLSGTGEISIWDGETFELIQVIPTLYLADFFNSANILTWSPDDPELLAGVGQGVQLQASEDMVFETDPIVFVLNTTTGERIQEIPTGPGAYLLSLAWQPAGSYIIVGGEPASRVFDVGLGERIGAIAANSFDFTSLSWRPDGRFFAMGNYVFDMESFEQIGSFPGAIADVEWRPDGSLILFADADGTITVADPMQLSGYEEDTE